MKKGKFYVIVYFLSPAKNFAGEKPYLDRLCAVSV